MAAPEVRNNPIASEQPPMAEGQDVAGSAIASDWFDEFKRVEKAFAVLGGVFFAALLVTYLGAFIENNAILVIGVVVLSVALVGMASLFFPLNWILLKGFLAWRRRRACERVEKI